MTREDVLRAAAAGAVAGAAGTTALNAVTYLDMTLRGRPASTTPEQGVEKLTSAVGLRVPGDRKHRQNRVSGAGALLGLATGVAFGALAGTVRGAGVRPPWALGALLTGGGAMLGANGPMAVLKVSDPRSWSRADWLSDVVPHLAYGAVTSAALRGLLR
jgi:hypothetical protein